MKLLLIWDDNKQKLIDAHKDIQNNFIIPNKIVFAGEIFEFTLECDPNNPNVKIYRKYKSTF